MDLVKAGFDVSMINFGQPRVGDQAYSDFVKTKLSESWRVVHNRDPVPHMPMSGPVLSFWQTCTEVYEDKTGSLKTCDQTCEDPTCGDQWAVWQYNSDDHCTYLGKYICCTASSLFLS
jgi:hypothetical protein